MDREVYGKPAPDVQNRVKTTTLGGLQLELVQPVSGQSVQREFLRKHGEGINHLGFRVTDLQAGIAKLVKKGYVNGWLACLRQGASACPLASTSEHCCGICGS
jgi:hypothetical protein